jgi:hypothetical protein
VENLYLLLEKESSSNHANKGGSKNGYHGSILRTDPQRTSKNFEAVR